jgi:hypothetical protein
MLDYIAEGKVLNSGQSFFAFLWEGSVSLGHGQPQKRPLSLSMIDTHMNQHFANWIQGSPKNWKLPLSPLVNQFSPLFDGCLRWSVNDHFQAPKNIVFPMSTYCEYCCSNLNFLWTPQLIYDQRLRTQILVLPFCNQTWAKRTTQFLSMILP